MLPATRRVSRTTSPGAGVRDPGRSSGDHGYDDLARRSQVRYNGTTGAAMNYTWSPESDLTTLASDLASTPNDVAFTNTFTPAHQWAGATTSNAAYIYAPVGTASAAYTANALNQYSLIGAAALSYDARGNYRGAAAAPSVAYDAENRLIAANTAGTIAYAYDPNGRRTAKTVGAVTTSFVHDGDGEIAEYDGAGALIRRFVPGPAVDDHIAQVTAGGVKTFFHTDKMGSTIAMSDMSGVLVEGPYVYDAYGTCLSGGANCLTLPATTQPFRFTGQRLDPETGLYYYRARYYISSFGRFAQTDPVGYKDDLNPYSYVGNDPGNRTDPTGLCAVQACKGGDFGGIEGCNASAGDCGGGWGGGTHDQRAAEQAVQGPEKSTIPAGTNGADLNNGGLQSAVYHPGQDNGSLTQANTTGMPATAPVLVVTDGRSIMHIAIFHMWFNVSGKSTYAEEYQSVAGINLLVDKTLHQSTGLPTGGGNWSFTADLGFYTDAAQTTTLNTVIVQPISSNVGRVVTMYPGGLTN